MSHAYYAAISMTTKADSISLRIATGMSISVVCVSLLEVAVDDSQEQQDCGHQTHTIATQGLTLLHVFVTVKKRSK